jgi:hypothetical protein
VPPATIASRSTPFTSTSSRCAAAVTSESVARFAVNPGAPQGLVGVDVAHAGDQGLIEQRAL